ncbi:MAG: nucleotidyltransferase domain-containing protein [Pontiellaceae bacterium]|nr:nucleotidyltransferase domain-containing protein [Pontiellaceae bacterium]MBN2785916.1 nucleotidyltransferase domain-containing protein [Pontiellaceae bacterium]
MRELISKTLDNVERDAACSVLYACESGSRAWGFASPDSDYDVRFIYVHDLAWYLNLEARKDTIDLMLPNDLDLGGWELQKSLRLFQGCNLALNEWIGSPIVYADEHGLRAMLKDLIPDYFNPKKAMFHYLNMANKASETMDSDGSIPIKKLFYVLRPLLACCWIQSYSSMPPTAFGELLEAELLPNDILREINSLLAEKAGAAEGFRVMIPSALFQWYSAERDKLETHARNVSSTGSKNWEPLNRLFRTYAMKTG